MERKVFINEAWWFMHIHMFSESTLEESIIHIKLL
jgi:hypothetical protein